MINVNSASTSQHNGQNGQTILTVAQAAERLQVKERTIRRYIEDGIAGPQGSRVKLPARLVPAGSGQEYQIGMTDLELFEQQRIQSVKERQWPAPPAAAQLVVGELEQERLHSDLQRAFSTIDQQAEVIEHQAKEMALLAAERGRFEGENTLLRSRVTALEAECRQGILTRLFRFILGVWL